MQTRGSALCWVRAAASRPCAAAAVCPTCSRASISPTTGDPASSSAAWPSSHSSGDLAPCTSTQGRRCVWRCGCRSAVSGYQRTCRCSGPCSATALCRACRIERPSQAAFAHCRSRKPPRTCEPRPCMRSSSLMKRYQHPSLPRFFSYARYSVRQASSTRVAHASRTRAGTERRVGLWHCPVLEHQVDAGRR